MIIMLLLYHALYYNIIDATFFTLLESIFFFRLSYCSRQNGSLYKFWFGYAGQFLRCGNECVRYKICHKL